MYRVVYMDELGNSKLAIITGAESALEAGYAFIAKHPAAQLIEATPMVGVEHIAAQAA